VELRRKGAYARRARTAAEDARSMLLQHVQTFCPRTKHLVLLCLGADIAMLSVLSDPNAKTNGKSKKECLRITMVHGDIVVLSGGQFKASNIRIDRRTLISFGSPQWSVQACVCVSGSISTTSFLADGFYSSTRSRMHLIIVYLLDISLSFLIHTPHF
jgi:hypothetical protein